jgi:hypothetical protein
LLCGTYYLIEIKREPRLSELTSTIKNNLIKRLVSFFRP